MKRYYRCYFLCPNNTIQGANDIAAADDAAAVAEAQRRFEARPEFAGFEVWAGSRRLYHLRPPARARETKSC